MADLQRMVNRIRRDGETVASANVNWKSDRFAEIRIWGRIGDMTDLLRQALVTAHQLAPEDQDRIARTILAAVELPVIEA